jgi:hypothetical protein
MMATSADSRCHELDLKASYNTVDAFKEACNKYAKYNGFKLVVRNHGLLLCGRSGAPDANRKRSSGCGCGFQISYLKSVKTGKVVFRPKSTKLAHNHEVIQYYRAPGIHIDSEREVTEEMNETVKRLVKLEVPRGIVEKELKETFNIQTINSVTFRSVIENARDAVGKPEDGHDVAAVAEWLQTDSNNSSFFQIGLDNDRRCNKLFFMNQAMINDFRRIGQVLIMDCTCKTNRLGWALFVCVGINQHLKSVILAVAAQKSEDISSFDWILDCMKRAVGDQAWKNIRMIMTDGDAALLNSLSTRIPHAKHHRCRWHISQNIRTNCLGQLGQEVYKTLTTKYYECVFATTVDAFNSKWVELLLIAQPYPNVARYLTDNIYTTREHWAAAWTDDCCSFNIHTTQRVEGENSVIKQFPSISNAVSLLKVFQRVLEISNNQAQKTWELDKTLPPKDHFTRGTLSKTAFAAFTENMIKAVAYKATARGDVRDGDFRIESLDEKESFLVKIGLTFMSCSCHYPARMLLPCHHVIIANTKSSFLRPFVQTQVHPRWYHHSPPTTPPQPSALSQSAPLSSSTNDSESTSNTPSAIAITTVTTAVEHMSAGQLYHHLSNTATEVIKLVMARPSLVCVYEAGMKALSDMCYANTGVVKSTIPLSSTTPNEVTQVLEPLSLKASRGRSSSAASSSNPKNKVKRRRVNVGSTSSSVTTISAVS